MAKQKILITTGIFPPDIGGPASYGQTLARYLARDKAVVLITYASVFKSADDKKEPFRIIRVWRRWPKPLRQLIYLWRVFWLARPNFAKQNLSGLARQHDRILVLNPVGAGLAVVWAAKLFKKKFVVRISGDKAWETAVNSGRTSLLIDDFQKVKKTGVIGLLHKFQSWVCREADLVIAHSKYLAKLIEGWGVAPEKIKLIYNGVDFQPSALSTEEARVKIGIAGNIILSAGRLAPWKGFRMLVKIMSQLLVINQFFRLVIVGDGPERSVLAAMIKNLRLDKKVYLVGKKSREELAVYLAAAELFVYNTGYEGFSHQILEAMTAGVPVVTTTAGGNPELIEQGENGFMVKYNDEFNLSEAIKTLWQTPNLRQRFIEAGKTTAQHFSVEKMLKETTAIFN
ncbi:MAG: glycosyltransferase family 4 protein [Patescibacteria group bacterium]